jgi:hypothetical protein
MDLQMIIPTLKLWVFVALIFWLILLWKWEWTSIVLGHKRVQIKDPERPWWKVPEQEWVECEPSYLNAAWFALAWPLLLCSFLGYILTKVLIPIVDYLADLIERIL